MLKIEKYVTESLEAKVLVKSTNQPQTSYAVVASLSEFKFKNILINKIEENKSINITDIQKNLCKALVESYSCDKDIISSYRSKRRRSGKETESSKEQTHKESKSTSSSKGASRSQPKSLGKSTQTEEHGQKADDLEEHSHQEFNTRDDDDYFINNDLEYLKGGSSSQKYTTSVTKTKAADYGHVKWIEYKVSRIWSPLNVVYNKHAYWGTYHWGLKRQKFYGYASNIESSKDVYSRHRIIAVTSLKIMKYFGYSHLEEVIVRRQDDQLYKFREGDFKRLRQQDIEDMLLLLVQDKLSNLNLEEQYALNVALRMFTRCIVIQECVEDL
ncbi:hypothetical protein Tco_0425269 [Tanacetum coccineum]